MVVSREGGRKETELSDLQHFTTTEFGNTRAEPGLGREGDGGHKGQKHAARTWLLYPIPCPRK